MELIEQRDISSIIVNLDKVSGECDPFCRAVWTQELGKLDLLLDQSIRTLIGNGDCDLFTRIKVFLEFLPR